MALDRPANSLYANPRPWGVQQRALSHVRRTQYARLWSVTHQQQQQRRSTSTRNLIRSRDDDNQQSALQPTSTDPTLHLAVRRW